MNRNANKAESFAGNLGARDTRRQLFEVPLFQMLRTDMGRYKVSELCSHESQNLFVRSLVLEVSRTLLLISAISLLRERMAFQEMGKELCQQN